MLNRLCRHRSLVRLHLAGSKALLCLVTFPVDSWLILARPNKQNKHFKRESLDQFSILVIALIAFFLVLARVERSVSSSELCYCTFVYIGLIENANANTNERTQISIQFALLVFH